MVIFDFVCEWVIGWEFGDEVKEGLWWDAGGCADAVRQNQSAHLFDQCLGELNLLLKQLHQSLGGFGSAVCRRSWRKEERLDM